MNEFVLLTGGAGYIGSHTAVELLNAGFEVLIADNLSNSYYKALDGIEKITGKRPVFEPVDFTQKEEVFRLFENYSFIAVIHFAAFKAVGESIQKPLKYYFNNLTATTNLLDAINKTHNGLILIFSSSCTVYGNPDYLPVDEKHPYKPPTSPYGYTKYMSEIMMRDLARINSDFQAIFLRYFNPIGAHPSGLIGESSKVTYNLVPVLVETATGKRDFTYVFGNDYPTPDGTPVRDYIHVVDLATAHTLALKRLIGKKNKQRIEAFNVGLGRGYSVLEIIKTFEKVTGKKLNYKITDRRPGDVAAVWASNDLITKELNWKPKYGLEDMLLSAWLWESKFKYY